MADGTAEPDDKQLIRNEHTKKPYTKPAFRFEQVFVTTALSCGKFDPTEFNCSGLNRKVS